MDKVSEKQDAQVILEKQIAFFKGTTWVLVAIGFIAGIWGLWQFYSLTKTPTLNDWGNLGSYFQGAVGSVWALAGLMFIYVAFLGQRLQMAKQDEELQAQQRNFELQQKSILLQQFESGFFQLLNLFNEVANKMHDTHITVIDSGYGAKVEHDFGRHLFERWYSELKVQLGDANYERFVVLSVSPENLEKPKVEISRQYVNIIYKEKFYAKHQGELSHYFRTLYHVFKFVNTAAILKAANDKSSRAADDNKETTQNKRRYTSIVRAQLSQYELALLFYNCVTRFGEKDFKPLVEKYGLLENFNNDDLIDQEHLMFFEDGAYKDSNE